ncbi:putative lysine-specific demethylase ELF6 [Vitis vinifera]|uniref:Putative lysine-specific demethylase ELF6 n=1 Tax=Vitis vinifera TaxID=29760 RepID=A0A438GPQ2_VITVI|nr:putative lysine-specific demethylase ELF6 [Vitis vinifera]
MDHQIMEEVNMTNEPGNLTQYNSEGQHGIQIENVVIEESCTNDGSGDEEHILSNVAMTNQPPPPSTVESSEIPREICPVEDLSNGAEDLENMDSNKVNPNQPKKQKRKRKREGGQKTEDKFYFDSFIRSPCEGLRPRAKKDGSTGADTNKPVVEKPMAKTRKPADTSDEGRATPSQAQTGCPHEGCGKKFSSHKYAMLHQRVHDDERPLKCPWKGCSMSFKWAWARTEHVRVHTGARPYQCKVEGCGLSFRFVSDFSRHRRKTGHYVNNTPK